MRKSIKIITSLLLAGVFLLSFTGLRLLLHHCMGCDTYEMHLFSKVDPCCATSDQTASTANYSCSAEATAASCCNLPAESSKGVSCENCCDDQVVYIKNKYEFVSGKTQLRVELPVLAHFGFFNHPIGSAPVQIISFSSSNHNEPPPPKLAGKSFVLFSHQIKIG
jgi:hypothetical protein